MTCTHLAIDQLTTERALSLVAGQAEAAGSRRAGKTGQFGALLRQKRAATHHVRIVQCMAAACAAWGIVGICSRTHVRHVRTSMTGRRLTKNERVLRTCRRGEAIKHGVGPCSRMRGSRSSKSGGIFVQELGYGKEAKTWSGAVLTFRGVAAIRREGASRVYKLIRARPVRCRRNRVPQSGSPDRLAEVSAANRLTFRCKPLR